MDIATITMPVEQAQVKLAAYRQQLQQRADAEYEAAALGYRELAAGRPLLNLTDSILRGGLGADERPRLAIARADRGECWVEIRGRSVTFGSDNRWRSPRSDTLRHTITHNWTFSRFPNIGYALVPMIPADVRATIRANADLSKLFILWEVEHWAERSNLVRPDRDPYLLRHIAGDLYAVVAQWDLTDLERAILADRVVA